MDQATPRKSELGQDSTCKCTAVGTKPDGALGLLVLWPHVLLGGTLRRWRSPECLVLDSLTDWFSTFWTFWRRKSHPRCGHQSIGF